MKEPTRREQQLAEELVRAARGCPPADRLSAYLARTGPSPEMETIESHLGDCPACRAALEFLESDAAQDEDASPPLPESVRLRLEGTMAAVTSAPGASAPRAGSRAGWMKMAAGILLVVSVAVAGYLVWPPSKTAGDLGAFRGEEGLEAIEPSGKLDSPPAKFRWSVLPGARGYQVLLFDEELNEIWSGAAAGETSTLALSPGALGLLRGGGRFSWQVLALDGQGFEIARSAVTYFEFALSPPTP